MSTTPLSRSLRALPGALGWGLASGLILPIALAYGALGLGHLTGGCGAGSSGGCEMGAASLALIAAPFAFVLGAGFGFWRGWRR